MTQQQAVQKLSAVIGASRPAILAALGLPPNDSAPLEDIWAQFAARAASGAGGGTLSGLTRRTLTEGADYTVTKHLLQKPVDYPEGVYQAMFEERINQSPALRYVPGTVLCERWVYIYPEPWDVSEIEQWTLQLYSGEESPVIPLSIADTEEIEPGITKLTMTGIYVPASAPAASVEFQIEIQPQTNPNYGIEGPGPFNGFFVRVSILDIDATEEDRFTALLNGLQAFPDAESCECRQVSLSEYFNSSIRWTMDGAFAPGDTVFARAFEEGEVTPRRGTLRLEGANNIGLSFAYGFGIVPAPQGWGTMIPDTTETTELEPGVTKITVTGSVSFGLGNASTCDLRLEMAGGYDFVRGARIDPGTLFARVTILDSEFADSADWLELQQLNFVLPEVTQEETLAYALMLGFARPFSAEELVDIGFSVSANNHRAMSGAVTGASPLGFGTHTGLLREDGADALDDAPRFEASSRWEDDGKLVLLFPERFDLLGDGLAVERVVKTELAGGNSEDSYGARLSDLEAALLALGQRAGGEEE